MIKAKIRTNDKQFLSLSLSGHAGTAEAGKDLLCASASILAYTVAQLVKDYEAKGMLKGKANIILESGKARISCTPKKDCYDLIAYAFYVAQTGFYLLAHNYPDHVQLTETLDIGITP